MPLPSLGCLTCRARRIKCDQARPVCGQCLKSVRECAGYGAKPKQLAFRSENKYASGAPRRPRHNDSERSSKHTPDILCSVHTPRGEVVREGGKSVVWGSLPESMERHALVYFQRKLVQGERTDLATSIYMCFDQVCERHNLDDNVQPHLLATAAVSLMLFGKAMSLGPALSASKVRYIQALSKVKSMIEIGSYVTSDQLLMAVMLLGQYDITAGSFTQTSIFSEGFRHHIGASALLSIRHNAGRSNQILDKLVRRQIMTSFLCRATPIPQWMQNGADFGEETYDLILDKYIVDVVQLRSQAAQLRRIKISSTPNDPVQMHHIVDGARQADDGLILWSELLPLEMTYQLVVNNKSKHVYINMETAATWNRYRIARIVANTILMYASQDMTEIESAETNIRNMVDEICASVPFFLEWGAPVDRITAREAGSLPWPLVFAYGSTPISEDTRTWVRDKLLLVSQITGNGVIRQVANMDLKSESSFLGPPLVHV